MIQIQLTLLFWWCFRHAQRVARRPKTPTRWTSLPPCYPSSWPWVPSSLCSSVYASYNISNSTLDRYRGVQWEDLSLNRRSRFGYVLLEIIYSISSLGLMCNIQHQCDAVPYLWNPKEIVIPIYIWAVLSKKSWILYYWILLCEAHVLHTTSAASLGANDLEWAACVIATFWASFWLECRWKSQSYSFFSKHLMSASFVLWFDDAYI